MPYPAGHRSADRLISALAAARSLGVDVATLRRWHACRTGPTAAHGPDGELRYRAGDLEIWQNGLGVRQDLEHRHCCVAVSA